MAVAKKQRGRAGSAARALAAAPWSEVLENLTDAVVLLSPAGQVVSCNPAGELLLGRPESQIRGRDLASLFHDSPAVEELVRRTLATRQTQALHDESLMVKGRRLTARMVTSPLHDPVDGLRGVAVVIHDLSHQRALREDNERAERLAHLGVVAAGLAHEIKNPLAGIKGAAQLLQRDLGENVRAREYAEVMVREADRLTALLEQLLNLASPAPAILAPLNIHRLIQDVLLLVRESPKARGVHIELDFDPTLPPVRGDERQLKQVLLNLMGNAFDALQGSGTVTLTTRMETDFHIVRDAQRPARFIRVEVADTGPGIAPENLGHVFDPFFSTKAHGTGLGLAISHRIASEHGGTLRAAPGARGGTVMTLNLPVDLEAQ